MPFVTPPREIFFFDEVKFQIFFRAYARGHGGSCVLRPVVKNIMYALWISWCMIALAGFEPGSSEITE